MDKRINLGMDYIRDNIDNFFNVTALKEDKEDQLMEDDDYSKWL
ncbi:hypothetical protein AMBR_FBHANALA_00865 [Dolosigranulum pigrum]|nr:hypothetical protein AMBR_FBHANALA_00865 [Dolosigranulum pigrum]